VAVPIGWADLDTSRGAWAIRILGWLIVGAAATLGGPFWWDLLGRALKYRRESNA
jgi:hypothetical protein